MRMRFLVTAAFTCASVLLARASLAETDKLQAAKILIQQAVGLPDDSPQLATILAKASEVIKQLLAGDKPPPPDQSIPLIAGMGQLYQNRGQTAESLEWWRKVVSLDSSDWRAWAKIIQCCQTIGDIQQRDEARQHVLSLANQGKVNQAVFCRDQFKDHGNPVMVLEYWKHEQPKPGSNLLGSDDTIYSFIVRSPDLKATMYRYVLIEMSVDTALARETKRIRADEHTYSIDRYEGTGRISLIGMYDGKEPPLYDKVKDAVVADLARNLGK